MNAEQLAAVGRLQAWIRDYGHEKQPEFIADLKAVLAALAPQAVGEQGETILCVWCGLTEAAHVTEATAGGVTGKLCPINGVSSQFWTAPSSLEPTSTPQAVERYYQSLRRELDDLGQQNAILIANLACCEHENADLSAKVERLEVELVACNKRFADMPDKYSKDGDSQMTIRQLVELLQAAKDADEFCDIIDCEFLFGAHGQWFSREYPPHHLLKDIRGLVWAVIEIDRAEIAALKARVAELEAK